MDIDFGDFSRDEVCPDCGKTINYRSIPPARLQLRARLLLASVGPIIVVFMTIFVCLAWNAGLSHTHLLHVAWLPWVVPIVVTWLAMRLPKVVCIRCSACGWQELRYRKNWAGQPLSKETLHLQDDPP